MTELLTLYLIQIKVKCCGLDIVCSFLAKRPDVGFGQPTRHWLMERRGETLNKPQSNFFTIF